MLKKIEIENFRGFKSLKADNLARVNLITGDNGIGKTSFLEAIFLIVGGQNPAITMVLNNNIRALNFSGNADKAFLTSLKTLFYQFKGDINFVLTGVYSNKTKHHFQFSLESDSQATVNSNLSFVETSTSTNENDLVKLIVNYSKNNKQIADYALRLMPTSQNPYNLQVFPEPPKNMHIDASFIVARGAGALSNQEITEFGGLEIEGKQDAIINGLKIIEPRLKNLRSISSPTGNTIHADIGLARTIPLGLLGDGFNHFFRILLKIAKTINGIILIDEIASGVHHSFLEEIWNYLAQLAEKYDVQLFTTTHSYECVESAYAAFKNTNKFEQLALHRLQRDINSNIEIVTYSKKAFEGSMKFRMEVR